MRDTATFPASPVEVASNDDRFWTWPRIAGVSILTLLIMALGVMAGIYTSWHNSGQIAPGLILQGEPLGGLSREEATQRLNKRFGRLFVNLQTPERSYRLSVKQLGGQLLIPDAVNHAYWYGRSGSFAANAWNYWASQKTDQRRALQIKWHKDRLRKTMWTVATNYQRPARDAQLQVTTAGIQILPDEDGRAINVGETCKRLQQKYFAGKPELKATTRVIVPRLVAADLVGRDVMFGKYTTYFDSGLYGRTTNIRLAADAINGKVLMPNEKFSFNAMTGERTRGKGYRVAHIFVHKPGKSEAEVVDGRGGGVCQVSSTLYNAVRKTNNKTDDHLNILERNSHSLPVTYVPSGLDATVAWPHKDFQFRNAFAHPVYIRTAVAGSRITISIWGRVPENVQSVTVSANPQAAKNSDDPA